MTTDKTVDRRHCPGKYKYTINKTDKFTANSTVLE